MEINQAGWHACLSNNRQKKAYVQHTGAHGAPSCPHGMYLRRRPTVTRSAHPCSSAARLAHAQNVSGAIATLRTQPWWSSQQTLHSLVSMSHTRTDLRKENAGVRRLCHRPSGAGGRRERACDGLGMPSPHASSPLPRPALSHLSCPPDTSTVCVPFPSSLGTSIAATA